MFATRVRTRRRSFATAWSIAKLKPPLCSAENKLPIGVKIPFSTKCGEWVIYAEPVTYCLHFPDSFISELNTTRHFILPMALLFKLDQPPVQVHMYHSFLPCHKWLRDLEIGLYILF